MTSVIPGPTGPDGRVHDLALRVRRPDGAPAAEAEDADAPGTPGLDELRPGSVKG